MSEKKSSNRIINILGWVIPILIIILVRNYFNKMESEINDYFANGGSEAVEMFDNYDSLFIDKVIIKYPKNYRISDKYGSDNLGGYTLVKGNLSIIDELTIGYSTLTTIKNSINNLKEELIITLKAQTGKSPSVSDIEEKKLYNHEVYIQKLKYGNNVLFIYALEVENRIIRFTSHKEYFLDAIIENIEVYDIDQSIKNKNVTNNSASTEIKTVNKLKIPLYDWKIVQDLDIKEIKTHQIILGNDEDIICIISTTNDYITNLREYSDYYNEKTVRNMKPSGLIFTSKGVKNGKFQGINSVTELFSAYHKPTGKKYEMEAVTIKIGDYFYNLSYATNEKSKKVINNIQISNQ